MKKDLEIEITNLYGSAEFPRQITVDKPKLSRTKKRVTKRSDIDISVTTETGEQTSEQALENVNSFNYVDGKPTIRLGGSYGKMVGLLKDAGMTLAAANTEGFTQSMVRKIVPTIQIIPEWPLLDVDGHERKTIKGLVSVNSMFGGRSTQKPTMWDIIPVARTRVSLIYPDAFDRQISEMLKMSENLNFAERRRAKMRVVNGG